MCDKGGCMQTSQNNQDNFYLKLQNCITFLQQWTIYTLNALTREHVNNFCDTSTPIYQTKNLVGTYTGPDAGRVNKYIHVWIIKALKFI